MDFNDLIGKPFASEPEYAFGPDYYSCYGLIWEVFRRYDIHIPKINISVTACKQTSNQTIEEHATKYWQKIQSLQEPCGIVITSTHPDYAAHIGAYIGENKMIHITINRNVTVDKVRDWKNKIIGYYTYVG